MHLVRLFRTSGLEDAFILSTQYSMYSEFYHLVRGVLGLSGGVVLYVGGFVFQCVSLFVVCGGGVWALFFRCGGGVWPSVCSLGWRRGSVCAFVMWRSWSWDDWWMIQTDRHRFNLWICSQQQLDSGGEGVQNLWVEFAATSVLEVQGVVFLNGFDMGLFFFLAFIFPLSSMLSVVLSNLLVFIHCKCRALRHYFDSCHISYLENVTRTKTDYACQAPCASPGLCPCLPGRFAACAWPWENQACIRATHPCTWQLFSRTNFSHWWVVGFLFLFWHIFSGQLYAFRWFVFNTSS